MKIIIKLKPSATLARIETLSEYLELMKESDCRNYSGCLPFADVIESITAEKEA